MCWRRGTAMLRSSISKGRQLIVLCSETRMWVRTSRSTCAGLSSLLFLHKNSEVGEVGEGSEGGEAGPAARWSADSMRFVANAAAAAAAIDADRDTGRWAAVVRHLSHWLRTPNSTGIKTKHRAPANSVQTARRLTTSVDSRQQTGVVKPNQKFDATTNFDWPPCRRIHLALRADKLISRSYCEASIEEPVMR